MVPQNRGPTANENLGNAVEPPAAKVSHALRGEGQDDMGSVDAWRRIEFGCRHPLVALDELGHDGRFTYDAAVDEGKPRLDIDMAVLGVDRIDGTCVESLFDSTGV